VAGSVRHVRIDSPLSVLYVIALAAIANGDPAGNIVVQHLATPTHFEFFCRVVQWLVIVILRLFSFALIYRFGPNLKNRRRQWSIPGPVVVVLAAVAGIGFTTSIPKAEAQVSIDIGVAPECPHGYYDVAPYNWCPVWLSRPGMV
jgi:uncharacterized BrkB/YihY/UPF0761 family membrane protein